MKKDDTLMSSRVSRDVLTPKEHSEVNEFWSRFYNIRHTAHEYYTQITGKFYKEYIPNSLWKRIIEVNFNDAGLESLQLTNGPVFGSRTEEILSEVFLKK